MTPSDGGAPPLARAGLDRSAEERSTVGHVETLRARADSRVLVVHGDTAPLTGSGDLLLVAPDALADGASSVAEWAFLGRAPDGGALLVAVLPREAAEPFPAGGGWAGLRVVGGDLDAADAGLFVTALSLGRWLLDARFCPACGSATELRNAGWSRSCPACGREHFPRTDPAVIVAVTSAADPDLLLLGSNALWGADRYSCFAGFVEAGESLESAVVREVREEAGVRVQTLRYRSSEAWPYPRSLMLGFTAEAVDDAEARADGDEIAALRWFSRDEIGAALRGEGDVLLPGAASIAHALIADWHAGRG